MIDGKRKQVEQALLNALEVLERELGVVGVTPNAVLEQVSKDLTEGKLEVPEATMRGAIWHLIDKGQVEFTNNRRLKTHVRGQAA